MSPQGIARTVGIGLLIFCAVIMASSGTYVVQPGFRGVEVTMGKVSPAFKPEGFGLKAPIVTVIHPVSIRQQTAEDKADCYSADLQQIHVELRVLYRIPEASVVRLFQEYYGHPFETLIAPRVQEALKEVTALQSAEQIVKNREQIKTRSLQIAKQKVGTLLVIEDIVIQDIALSKELGHAIEAKMVQEQEAPAQGADRGRYRDHPRQGRGGGDPDPRRRAQGQHGLHQAGDPAALERALAAGGWRQRLRRDALAR